MHVRGLFVQNLSDALECGYGAKNFQPVYVCHFIFCVIGYIPSKSYKRYKRGNDMKLKKL